jgi:HTH-type transcriptional regulator, sugar sensing transcriptional regulator
MNIIQALKNIGLNEKEAKVYISLLQTGKATAYSVAKHSNIKKSTTYVVLEDLIDKGIVTKVPRAKTMQFIAIPPGDLFSIAKSKLDNAERDALPELKALNRGKNYKVRVSYYEGMNGVKEMYGKIFKEVKTAPKNARSYVGFYAHGKNTPVELKKYFDEVRSSFRKDGINRRGITTYDNTITEFLDKKFLKMQNLELKALPISKYNSNVSIEIFRNKTYIFSHKHLQVTVIDNPDIARVMKQIFELVWERDEKIFKKPTNKQYYA